jgi:hypothetical protein
MLLIDGNNVLAHHAAIWQEERSFVTVHLRVLGIVGNQTTMDGTYVADGVPNLLGRASIKISLRIVGKMITLLEPSIFFD